MSWCECMTEEEFFDQYVDWETAVAHMAPETRRAMWEERWAEIAEHEAEERQEA